MKKERLILRLLPRILTFALSVLVPTGLIGATYYVDGNCPGSGAGTSLACGSSGPKKTIADGVALLSSPGDVLVIRGVHPAHDGEGGAFDGRYFDDWILVSGKNGSATANIKIQPYNY